MRPETPAFSLPSEEDLLGLYLTLSPEARKERFATTAQAAELVGLSQRTIQWWVESGKILAVSVGKKYQVDLQSLRGLLEAANH